jgi:hypothetical protein
MLVGALAAIGLAGCGGSYLSQWSVAGVNQQTQPGPNGAACDQASATVQQIDFSSDQVVTIYSGGKTDADYFLDMPGQTLGGSKTADGFHFSTTTTEVVLSPTATNPVLKTTHTLKEDITFHVNGSLLTGTALVTDTTICNDLNNSQACEQSGQAKPHECDTSADLHGTKLDDPKYRTDTGIPTQGGPAAGGP